MTTTTLVRLTDKELSLLDGKCNEKVQEEVVKAINRLGIKHKLDDVPEHLQDFVTRVVEEAEKNKLLVFRHRRASRCKVCGKSAGYAKYARNSRSHKKGAPNYDRPLTFSGIELAQRSVTMQNSLDVGCCADCWEEAESYVKTALTGIEAELPAQIGDSTKYKRYRNRKCKCGWMGHEGQMTKKRTMMGDGYYPAGCPECGLENSLFSTNNIELAKGYALVGLEKDAR